MGHVEVNKAAKAIVKAQFTLSKPTFPAGRLAGWQGRAVGQSAN